MRREVFCKGSHTSESILKHRRLEWSGEDRRQVGEKLRGPVDGQAYPINEERSPVLRVGGDWTSARPGWVWQRWSPGLSVGNQCPQGPEGAGPSPDALLLKAILVGRPVP